ncbi:MAG: TetR/AcrR family transcriptional regulator, partial [Caulobacteraceae bacterium]
MTETFAAPAQARGATTTRRTQKFLNRQASILKAAVALINHKGVKGMTLADVAAQLDIVPTGVIYYFPSKEVLAAACFGAAIEAYEALIAEAARAPTPRQRLRRFVEAYVGRARDVALGKADKLAVFNDVRALGDASVDRAYTEMFRHARALIAPEPPPRGAQRQAVNAATHLALSQLFWSVVWLPLYEPDDYGRAAERLADLIENGLAAAGAVWPAAPPAPAHESTDDVSRETFL